MEPTLAGWTIMIVSIGSVCALTVFCFYRLFTLPRREGVDRLGAPIETGGTGHSPIDRPPPDVPATP